MLNVNKLKIFEAILIFPFTVLTVIPYFILSRFKYKISLLNDWQFYVAVCFASFGLFFFIWTVWLFWKLGKGTLAPWNPPKKLIISGPYCYVRNPMITSVCLMLIAESFYFQSWAIVAWFVIFVILNMIYFPCVEERGLKKRFGAEYKEYCKNVPRYIPRLTAWHSTKK